MTDSRLSPRPPRRVAHGPRSRAPPKSERCPARTPSPRALDTRSCFFDQEQTLALKVSQKVLATWSMYACVPRVGAAVLAALPGGRAASVTIIVEPRSNTQ